MCENLFNSKQELIQNTNIVHGQIRHRENSDPRTDNTNDLVEMFFFSFDVNDLHHIKRTYFRTYISKCSQCGVSFTRKEKQLGHKDKNFVSKKI